MTSDFSTTHRITLPERPISSAAREQASGSGEPRVSLTSVREG